MVFFIVIILSEQAFTHPSVRKIYHNASHIILHGKVQK